MTEAILGRFADNDFSARGEVPIRSTYSILACFDIEIGVVEIIESAVISPGIRIPADHLLVLVQWVCCH